MSVGDVLQPNAQKHFGTQLASIDVGGSFSPDGRQIVFESDRGGSQQIYVMNADGSGQQRISFFGGRAATPEWSPRGDQIAFTHIAGNFRIAVMDPSGGSMHYLTDNWQDEAPTWAPNGRVIQFFRTTRGTSGKTAIWQVDLTGRNERQLQTPVDGSDPAWGPLLPYTAPMQRRRPEPALDPLPFPARSFRKPPSYQTTAWCLFLRQPVGLHSELK